MTTVLSTTGVRKYVPGNLAQSYRIIQFPVGLQPSVRGDLGTVEFQLQTTVKPEPQNPCFPFTHRVSYFNTPDPPITY